MIIITIQLMIPLHRHRAYGGRTETFQKQFLRGAACRSLQLPAAAGPRFFAPLGFRLLLVAAAHGAGPSLIDSTMIVEGIDINL